MQGLDLGTLNIRIRTDGVERTQSDLNRLNTTVRQTETNTNRSGLSFRNLGSTLRNSIGDMKIFGVSLGDMGRVMSGGAGMAGLLGGAIGALAVQFIQLAVQAIGKAIQALQDFVKQGIATASALNEVQNVIDVTFEDGADSVNDWAKNTASAFGLSELQAKKYSGTLGAILKPSGLANDSIKNMSINLTQLSADLSSFWNKSTEESFNALRSAITGETEPIKQFGIVMSVVNLQAYALSQGIDKAWQSMTQAEQATLRYNYILENTKTAQGDFNRTQEEYANVGRTLENTIDSVSGKFGKGLLPALTDAKLYFIEYIKSNEEMIENLGKSIGFVVQNIMKVIEVATLPFRVSLNIIGKFYEYINPLVEKITPIFDKVRTTGDGVMNFLTGKIKKSNDEIKYSFETVTNTAQDTFNSIEKAYTTFKEREMKKYEESIRKSFASESLANEKEIQRKLSNYDRYLDQKLAKDAEYERRRASLSGGTGTIPAHATGTLYSRGGLALVGEHGAELVRLSSGDKVSTHTQTKEIINNNNNTDSGIVNALMSKVDEITRVLKDMPYKNNQFNKLGGVTG
ncbi:hypothetical protein [Cellulosilyticum sp. I15G10I2]|uniref:hypothetical protein n=1 Tax=Cellulosilyticum sp. I15G10I2 TaxID=1892843 RepID=UPI00085BF859|nr:hypothetical protein [Cellulosilyticum sp. I15G10I2]